MRIKLFGKTSVALLVLSLAWVIQSTPALGAVSTVAYSTDANTVLLDHFDGATSATVLAYSENGAACGAAKPSATPSSAYGSGPNGLSQALSLNPPTGQPVGSATYLQYPGGQRLSQPNGTIEFWTYLTSYGAGVSLVDQGQFYTACNGWTFSMGVSAAGQLNAGAWAAFSMNSGTTSVPLNTWTHVAASWGSAGAKLYINGVQVGSDANTGMPASGYGGSVLIRAGTHTGANGQIDELRISNVQRTSFATEGGIGTGAHSSSGTYTWNPATGTLTLNTTSSNFLCDGFPMGMGTITNVTVTTGTMTWAKTGGGGDIFTKSPAGAANDVIGAWTWSDTKGSGALTFNSDGSYSLVAVIVQCSGDGGGGTGTGTHSASGTYTWNSATATITVSTASSDFICDGLTVGTESVTGVAISSGAMTWTKPDGTVEMTWTRSAGGVAGDIVGIWTASESIGNSYTLAVNRDGTFSLSANIIQCGGGSGGQNPYASSQHWPNGYYVQLQYRDFPKTANSVSVTGPGISGSKALTYDNQSGSWASWVSPSTSVFFGTSYPAGLPYTYTFSISASTTSSATSTISCFQVPVATNVAPTGSVTGTPAFSWTGIADSGAVYRVEVNDSAYNRVWNSNQTSGTALTYTGPALILGASYNYNVVVDGAAACANGQSFAQGSFTYGSGSGGSDTTAPTVPTGVNAYAMGPTAVDVSWSASTDNIGVTYYQVYRNGAAAGAPSGANNTFWMDNQVSAGNTYTYTVAACDAARNCSAQSGAATVTTPTGTGSYQFDGPYTGTWSVTCPACGDTAAGMFSLAIMNGQIANLMANITSGTHGILFTSGTLSSTGAITGSGDAPPQCSGSVSTFSGQITVNGSGGADMNINYSRPASGSCGAETGTLTATRTSGGSSTSSTTTSTSTTTTSSTTTTTLGGGTTAILVPGWNLVGNSSSGAIDVAAAFGDKAKVTTVWKWIASTIKWAFYAPSLADGGAAYAAGKGYEFLTSISGGEGFWVNAGAGFSLPLPTGSAIPSSSFQQMGSGWNLIAIGDAKTPSAFNKALSVEPPSPGVIPVNLTTLWTWDATQLNWYFYAPSLEANGGLAAYITSKSYLNFDTKTLGATTGFWVNKP